MAFQYPPLPKPDAIRLLILKPRGFYDQLTGILESVTFSERPKYLALSYTWESRQPDTHGLPLDELTLNGHDIPIKRNLALALRYLRSENHPLPLWIDAVCIDQGNIDERNDQVALMASIYSRATAVITWLGFMTGDEIRYLYPPHYAVDDPYKDPYNRGNSKELATWFTEHTLISSTTGSRNPAHSNAAEIEALQRIEAINQHGNKMVMTTSYWQRLWVVQEVGLAQKIFFVCGPTVFVNEENLRWAHQMQAVKIAKGMGSMLEARRTRFTNLIRLQNLIEQFAGQICSEPRDKIYSLVGLANDVIAVQSSSSVDDGKHIGGPAESIQYIGSEDVEFVIDYRRRFYDIWCGVVLYIFQCPHYFVPDHLDTDEEELSRLRHERLTNVVRFAGIVQNTLQDEVERELTGITTSTLETERNSILGPKLFGHHLVPIRGYVAGRVLDLGPSYADFVASFRHQTAWKTKWRKHYRKEVDLAQLREMEETYSAKILNYSDADIARIAPLLEESFVTFRSPDNGPLDDLTAAGTHVDGIQIIESMLSTLSAKTVPQTVPDGRVSRFLGTKYCMGLAPPGTVVGDWVIRFWDCDAAIIVRPNEPASIDSPCALVGRADVAEVRDRKGPFGDTLGNQALTRHANGDDEDTRMDMVMTWYTLQRITASIDT
ncbi:heterokaryon incompatibility protein-domain-containing protein [Xylaria bambusicola]|uniref:heterokaryon incompatibility protein-domain-containing protein n=1 Tax=Xylaria bambusicola TaxID=326684 RepID=UPI0020073A9F|nr:heterokaryon incompatibility protein-domain-containing protein [Xylaria bambusicola]KAI0517557.1 heterokaryon incompatibility protein-domain-containing protein [Xylaria bambusicola]